MKIILNLVVVIILNTACFSQISDLPQIKEYVLFEEGRYEYNDTIPRDRFRENGSPFIVYENIRDTIVRKEYFENGLIKSIAQITHEFRIDTTAYLDRKDNEYKIQILKRLIDIPNGSYIEYQKWKKKKIQSKGKCINGKRYGKWQFHRQNGDKIIANFNSLGHVNGEYKEYYYNSRDSIYSLKLEGKFGERNYNYDYKSIKSGELITRQKIETRRIDKWKYYSKDGSLLEIVTYDWKTN